MDPHSRPRLLVFVVAYNAEATIQPTLQRIPARLLHDFDVEVLVIDDSSTDRTFDRGETMRRDETLPFALTVLFGRFNYGKRGILDLTHTRLFTFGTFRRLFEQSGFDVLEFRGVPAPFPLVVGAGAIGRFLIGVNTMLIALSRSLFAYQIFAVVRPRPTLQTLLDRAQRESGARSAALAKTTAVKHRSQVLLSANLVH